MQVASLRKILCNFSVVCLNSPNSGFKFGHSVFGTSKFEAVHFAFEFYNFQTFNALVNPNNLLAQTVLSMMIESGEYFFFATSKRSSHHIQNGNSTICRG